MIQLKYTEKHTKRVRHRLMTHPLLMYCRFYMCCHFVEGGLLEQAEDLVYYLVDIRGVVEFFQLFVEFVFHLFADLVG